MDLRSGLDVREAGVGLAAAGRSAEVPRDAAICRTNMQVTTATAALFPTND